MMSLRSHQDSVSRKGHDEATRRTSSGDTGSSQGHSGSAGKVGYHCQASTHFQVKIFQRSTRNWKNITTHVQVVERMKKASISSRDQRYKHFLSQ